MNTCPICESDNDRCTCREPRVKKQDRLSSYKKVGEFLNEKGAPSNIWSELESLLEPNGIFLKQREQIKILREALEFYAEVPNWLGNEIINDCNKQLDEYVAGGTMFIGGVKARTALREAFSGENDE